jgi:hypothetical protein
LGPFFFVKKMHREVFEKGLEKPFLEANNQLQVEKFVRNGSHPFVEAQYGRSKVSVWNKIMDIVHGGKKIISLRNLEAESILAWLKKLRDQWGTPSKSFKTRQWTVKKSLQGVWKQNFENKTLQK